MRLYWIPEGLNVSELAKRTFAKSLPLRISLVARLGDTLTADEELSQRVVA